MKINAPETGIIMSKLAATELWSKIESYEMPFGETYLNYKHKWDAPYATEAIQEYRKFVFLALISPTEVTPSENIDEVWHLHILHTRAYEQFANLCGRFLHHGPGLPSERQRWTRQYDTTFELYRSVFGMEPPAAFWPLSRTNGKRSDEPQPKIADALRIFTQRQGFQRHA